MKNMKHVSTECSSVSEENPTVLFEVSQTSPACPSDKASIVMNIHRMKYTGKETLGVSTTNLTVQA